MSPDSNEKNLGFIEKIESTEGGPVEFSLLSDSGNATIDHWALRDPAYAARAMTVFHTLRSSSSIAAA